MSLRRQAIGAGWSVWAIWAVMVFLLVSVFVLGVRPLSQPDEPRYGIIASEMVETGDWFSLRMAGFHYYEKPPMGYWMIAASITAFGENAFAIRLPSAIATGIIALAAGLLAVRITGRREMGPLAFIVQATTIGPMVMGTVASIDAMFSAWIAISSVAFYAACTSLGRARIGWLALTGAAAGFALLTKGPLGFAIPALTAVVFLIWQRRWIDLLRLPWIPLATSAIVVAPFAIALHRAEPGFWHYFFVIENFRRFASPDANQHREAWWYLIVLFPIGGVMWTLTWIRAARGLRRAHEWREGIRFAISWIVAPLILLSASAGKLPSYLLPLFAPIAVLVTLGLVCAYEQRLSASRIAQSIGRSILYILSIGAIAAIFTGTAWIGLPVIWLTSPALHLIVIAAALLIWSMLDKWSWRAADAPTWLMRSATAPVAMLAAIPFLFPDGAIRQTQIPWDALNANKQVLRSSSVVATTSQLAHCVTWVTGRRDFLIVGRPSEFDNELKLPQDDARLVSLEQIIAKIQSPDRGSIAIVTTPSEATHMLAAPGISKPSTHFVQGDIVILAW